MQKTRTASAVATTPVPQPAPQPQPQRQPRAQQPPPPEPTPPVEELERPEEETQTFTLLSSITAFVSKEEALVMAERHRSLPQSPTERDLDEKRLKQLCERIRSSMLLPCSWATVDYNGETVRMNGQHSSNALIECADSLPARLSIHLDHYEATGPLAMGSLFRQFDPRWSTRSRLDVSGAYQGLTEALAGIPRDKVKLGISGIIWFKDRAEGLPMPSGDDIYELIPRPQYHPFLRWLDGIISRNTSELKRTPIVAAMYGTFLSSRSGAQEFWEGVAKGVNEISDDTDPRKVLSEELLTFKDKGAIMPKPGMFYAKCVKAWNAFRKGDKPRTLGVTGKKMMPEIAS